MKVVPSCCPKTHEAYSESCWKYAEMVVSFLAVDVEISEDKREHIQHIVARALTEYQRAESDL